MEETAAVSSPARSRREAVTERPPSRPARPHRQQTAVSISLSVTSNSAFALTSSRNPGADVPHPVDSGTS